MAAGLGFKDFTTGEVLTAADVNNYLMQNIWVFASAAARDAAVTSPQEGNFAYLKDTNVTTYYTGSAWANLDTTGMTNPMTTTGDTIYSSSGSTPARLGIGSTGQVLTVAGGVPSWATPAGGGGGKVLQVVTATYSTQTTATSTTPSDTGLSASITPSATSSKVLVLITQSFAISKTDTTLGGGFRILRGSTSIYDPGTGQNGIAISGLSNAYHEMYNTWNASYLDSPSTTSSTTYKTQQRVQDTGSVISQISSTTSSIILLEIGA
jgi:hypothetical protein